nr:hypothetical protein [Rubellimicrobium rubrum]
MSTVDCYRAVVETIGGFEEVQSFSRFSIISGFYHCPCGNPELGDPATEVRLRQELVDWVESDGAPGLKTLPVIASTSARPVITGATSQSDGAWR